MPDVPHKLRDDIVKRAQVSKITKNESKHKAQPVNFTLLQGTNYVTLTKYQQSQLLNALKLYFPELYTEVATLHNYELECESDLDRFLAVLDKEMSADKHYNLYKDCYTAEYDFLRKLRMFYLVK